mgnify:CR=1 FL=1
MKRRILLFAVMVVASSLQAQSMNWASNFTPNGCNGTITAIAEDADFVYYAGAFTRFGPVAANCIARVDKVRGKVSPLGSGIPSGITSFIKCIVIIGNDVYVGGDFSTAGGVSVSNIAKWNGAYWSSVGGGVYGGVGQVNALKAVGTDLYVGGRFTSAGDISVNNIAKWNGTSWSSVGGGVTDGTNTLYTGVYCLEVLGGNVYAGGDFTTAGGLPTKNVAKWDGTSWTALGTGISGTVESLCGNGSDLYAGGYFSGTSGKNAIARWNGTAWFALGTGFVNGQVQAIAVLEGEVYAGGRTSVGKIAKWNGSTWLPLGNGVQSGDNSTSAGVRALAVIDGELHCGGLFEVAGEIGAGGVAKWTGSSWVTAVPGITGDGILQPVRCVLDAGSVVYVAGSFVSAGGTPANRIACWNKSTRTWSALGSGLTDEVYALAIDGTDLYAGGKFRSAGGVSADRIAKWDGVSWSPLSSGLDGTVQDIAVMGGNVFVGGGFASAGGVPETTRIAMWDGVAWASVGSGITGGTVNALATDGTTLYAGGSFTMAGGAAAARLAQWNGNAWSAMNNGINNGSVDALTVGGGSVFAGGTFSTGGGSAVSYVGRWDGMSWVPLGIGMNSYVRDLTFAGSQLYACGNFTTAGGVSAKGIAGWNGASWQPLSSGVESSPYSIASDGNEVYVGGTFSTAGGKASEGFAIYGPQPEIAVEYPVGTNLIDGFSTVVLPPVSPGSTSNTTFTIKNLGDLALVVAGVTISGANASEFSITAPPSSPVGSGGATTFTVQFSPDNANAKTALLQVVSNDLNEAPFDILVSVPGSNTPPTISSLPSQMVDEDVGTSTLSLSVADLETSSQFLSVSGTSSNGSLVPASNILLGGSGSNRTVRIVPSANASGSATITLTVRDGALQSSSSFLLSVAAINDPPTITGIADIVINEDTSTSARAFTIGDVETSATSLTVTGTSSDTNLVPIENIVFGGSGSNRNVTVTPAPNQFGEAVITVSVSDGEATSSTDFLLTVNPVNDAPTISSIDDQVLDEDANTGALPFSIGDMETAADSLIVTFGSSNVALVPLSSLVLGGNGNSRTLTVWPAANMSGVAIISLTVSDGTTTTSSGFELTVNAVNDAPTLNNIPNPAPISEDSGQRTMNLSGISAGGGETQTISVVATSNNPALIPSPIVSYSSPSTVGSVSYTPVANMSGTATITVTVNDGQAVNHTIERTFVVSVNAVNDPPRFDYISNPAAISEDAGLQTISLSGVSAGPLEMQDLLVTATSSNTNLIPHPTVSYTSPNSVGTLTYTPVPNAYGSAIITVTVNDQQASSNTFVRIFSVTVNPVNDEPTIGSLADRSLDEDTSTGPIAFEIGDVDTAASSLIVTCSSDNTTLVPTSSIVLGGSWTNRTVSIEPATNQFGTTTITIMVSDGLLTVSGSFLLTVNSINDAPSITSISDQVITYNTLSDTLVLTVGDVETDATSLMLTGSSSDQSLLSDASVFLSGSGAARSVTLVPNFNQTGIATVTLTVSDGDLSTTTSFMLTVNAPEIVVEQPFASGVDSGGARDFGNVPVGGNGSLVFYIRNTNAAALTGLSLTKDGPDAAQFVIASSPAAPVNGPGGNTAFTIQFTPTSPGGKTCELHIASNDPDENPFDLTLTGNGTVSLSSWRQTHFGTSSGSGIAEDLADPDEDGICNLIEYAFGLHPRQNSAGQLPQAVRSGDDLVYSFAEPPGVTGVNYSAEWTETMMVDSWTSVGIAHTANNRQHTFTLPVGNSERAFVRLKILVP